MYRPVCWVRRLTHPASNPCPCCSSIHAIPRHPTTHSQLIQRNRCSANRTNIKALSKIHTQVYEVCGPDGELTDDQVGAGPCIASAPRITCTFFFVHGTHNGGTLRALYGAWHAATILPTAKLCHLMQGNFITTCSNPGSQFLYQTLREAFMPVLRV